MKKSIGVLGGGQLGKMLFTAGSQLDIDIGFMDTDDDSPVGKIAKNYSTGIITSEEDVLNFGKDYDIITVEIEKVNVDALRKLEKENKLIYPQPEIIATIQDKALQKEFYESNNLPSSKYKVYNNLSSLIFDIDSGQRDFPFIQKMRKDGYDGRGVQVIKNDGQLDEAIPYNFIVEDLVDIDKELAVVTCRDSEGNVVVYEPVEMVFHPEKNILLYQLSPARISNEQKNKTLELAKKISETYGIIGLLAIEFFLTKSGEILINEVAPRPHNSGHHTIEAHDCSQYENHLRAISGLPMGSTKAISASLLMNILGTDGHEGVGVYEGLEETLSMEGVHVHLYGKTTTKPFRKMGHINITGSGQAELIKTAERIQNTLRVISSGD